MKKILIAFMMMFGMFGMMPAMNVSAEAVENYSSCGTEDAFFALKPWYAGLTTMKNGKCEVGTPAKGENGLPLFIWTIVLNILYDIMVLVGYIATVMIAVGGFLYMFSRGDPGRAEKGKKTLIAAVVGLIITMLASIIMNTVTSILTNNPPGA